ncbi:MAG: nucleotide modification associated domain-containing protein, partial [Ignavibacteria bacterium]|nr:nucleotide modification associated domain-containing protein [Ignavibacteria bacterium]
MTHEQQKQHFDAFVTKQFEILFKKGNDYANDDRLSNFKLAGNICGLTPAQNCLSLIATKVARLGVLLQQGKQPLNESISDSVIDLANYAVLLDMILSDI